MSQQKFRMADAEILDYWDAALDEAKALDDLAHYLRELFYEHYREADMQMVFHYDKYCELRRVDVLDDASKVVKTVRPGVAWRPFIGERVKEEPEA